MPFHVYILTNRTRTLYAGVTSDLRTRVARHKSHEIPGFTQRYNVDKLVYAEAFPDPVSAIEREKRIKRMTRAKRIKLIERENPEWLALAARLW